jgi:DNA-binding GntR family transcriptional regulator
LDFLSLSASNDFSKPLSMQVYDTVREAIICLKLKPGQMIYENELAESLGVSRTPIREAIRSLVNEQLLEVLPQRGTLVTYISERKVLETRFIQTQLELGAFRIAARTWDSSNNKATRQLIINSLEDQRVAADENNAALFLELDELFHRTILALADNATLLNVVYHMRGHLNRLRYMLLQEYLPMHRIVDEHAQLFAAIEANDEELTAKLLDGHLGKLNHDISEIRKVHPQYFLIE